MSLVITSGRLALMAAAGVENNPLLTCYDYVSEASITSDRTAATDGDVANIKEPGTFSFWVPETATQTTAALTFQLSAVRSVNFLGFVAHTLSGVSLTLAYSPDEGVTWVDIVAVTQQDLTNIGLYFEDVSSDLFRVSFEFEDGADIAIAAAALGELMTVPTRIYQGYTPPIQATQVTLQSNVTEGGNFVGASVVRRGQAGSFELSYLPDTFVRGDKFSAFQQRFNEGLPVFWAWRPMKYGDLKYAWRTGAPVVPTNSGPLALMSASVSFRAYNDYDAGAAPATIATAPPVVTPPADTTAPVISSVSVTPAITGASVGWSVDEAGAGHYLIDQNATRTAAQVQAGTAVSVLAAGAQTAIAVTGLTASTAYYAHLVVEDAAGNVSAVSSTAFTTSAAAASLALLGSTITQGAAANIPTEAVSGSFLVASVFSGGDPSSFDTVGGWTKEGEVFGAGGRVAGAVYSREVDGTEGATVTFGTNEGLSDRIVTSMIAVSGVDTVTPFTAFELIDQKIGGNQSVWELEDVTVTEAGSLRYAAAAGGWGLASTITVPADTTALHESQSIQGGFGGCIVSAATEDDPATGLTVGDFNSSVALNYMSVHIIFNGA